MHICAQQRGFKVIFSCDSAGKSTNGTTQQSAFLKIHNSKMCKTTLDGFFVPQSF